MTTTYTVYMPASHQSSVALRHWPFFALALASAFGAMYCAAEYALAASLTGSKFIVSNPEALDHWRRVATIYLASLGACLTIFVGSCIALRRRRVAAPVRARDPAI
jgi:hypothetical protein